MTATNETKPYANESYSTLLYVFYWFLTILVSLEPPLDKGVLAFKFLALSRWWLSAVCLCSHNNSFLRFAYPRVKRIDKRRSRRTTYSRSPEMITNLAAWKNRKLHAFDHFSQQRNFFQEMNLLQKYSIIVYSLVINRNSLTYTEQLVSLIRWRSSAS